MKILFLILFSLTGFADDGHEPEHKEKYCVCHQVDGKFESLCLSEKEITSHTIHRGDVIFDGEEEREITCQRNKRCRLFCAFETPDVGPRIPDEEWNNL